MSGAGEFQDLNVHTRWSGPGVRKIFSEQPSGLTKVLNDHLTLGSQTFGKGNHGHFQ